MMGAEHGQGRTHEERAGLVTTLVLLVFCLFRLCIQALKMDVTPMTLPTEVSTFLMHLAIFYATGGDPSPCPSLNGRPLYTAERRCRGGQAGRWGFAGDISERLRFVSSLHTCDPFQALWTSPIPLPSRLKKMSRLRTSFTSTTTSWRTCMGLYHNFFKIYKAMAQYADFINTH